MRKRKKTRSRSRTEKREDEPPEGPIIILEPKPGGGPLIWLQQAGGNPPAPLAASSQPSNGSLREDFIGVGVIAFGVRLAGGELVISAQSIRAATLDGTRRLEVRFQSQTAPLQWQLTQGTPPTTTPFSATAVFNPAEVPFELMGFEKLEYRESPGGSWMTCVRFEFQVHVTATS